jgi:hypothetical protein
MIKPALRFGIENLFAIEYPASISMRCLAMTRWSEDARIIEFIFFVKLSVSIDLHGNLHKG